MANNRFFDEANIIKKSPPVEIQEEQSIPEPLPIPMPEPEFIPEPVIEKPKRKKKEPVVKTQSVDAAEQYKKTLQQIIEEEPDVAAAQPKKPGININMEIEKPKKPVYNYSKQAGKINIETKAFAESKNQQVSQSSNEDERQEMIEDMLEKTEKELLRLLIELDVQVQVAIMTDGARKQIYENKTKTIQDEIKYNEKRKIVLEKMLSR